MKVYLVIEDWATDGNGRGVAVEVYSSRALAQKRLAEKADVITLTNHFDTIEWVKGDHIDAYIEDWYDDDHDHVYIEEQEIKEK